jgi:hypothetical protein
MTLSPTNFYSFAKTVKGITYFYTFEETTDAEMNLEKDIKLLIQCQEIMKTTDLLQSTRPSCVCLNI